MTTSADAIKHLWTHKTQDHPWLSDEELVIDRAEGVWVWTERGRKLLDGFAGLAVVNVGHGRRDIRRGHRRADRAAGLLSDHAAVLEWPAADARRPSWRKQTPETWTTRCSPPAGRRPTSGRWQIARHYWLARGQSGKHKVIALQGGYHGATMGTFAVCGLPHMAEPYAVLQVPGFAKATAPFPFRDRVPVPTRSWPRVGPASPAGDPSCARDRTRSPR